MTPDRFNKIHHEKMAKVKGEISEAAFNSGRFPEITKPFKEKSVWPEFADFLTLPAYQMIKG